MDILCYLTNEFQMAVIGSYSHRLEGTTLHSRMNELAKVNIHEPLESVIGQTLWSSCFLKLQNVLKILFLELRSTDFTATNNPHFIYLTPPIAKNLGFFLFCLAVIY